MFKISNLSKAVLAIGALLLLAMLKLPIWKIVLSAPQYPEGLQMEIWHNTFTGDVKVISALNHYIGMRAISPEMFPEFEFLGNVIIGVAVLCFVLALIGRWWSSVAYFMVLAIGDSAALYDFWKWGYDYGHNLDPTAPIVIPGMAYQPPVIGYKKLLNFEAWSLPDLGGWILMGVSTIAFLVMVYEWWKNRKMQRNPAVAVALLLLSVGGTSCASGPQPIRIGEDSCQFCKMILMDQKYGAEIITKKGRVYLFDDVNCMMLFEQADDWNSAKVATRYIVDFLSPETLIPVETAIYLESKSLKTPMASGIAAFANPAGLDSIIGQLGGNVLNWVDVTNRFNSDK
ncbi:MAG: nitrous oxide reductase accessory protein NosL [Saprospiraceae bacterium]